VHYASNPIYIPNKIQEYYVMFLKITYTACAFIKKTFLAGM
jgi:hypothetical protein